MVHLSQVPDSLMVLSDVTKEELELQGIFHYRLRTLISRVHSAISLRNQNYTTTVESYTSNGIKHLGWKKVTASPLDPKPKVFRKFHMQPLILCLKVFT